MCIPMPQCVPRPVPPVFNLPSVLLNRLMAGNISVRVRRRRGLTSVSPIGLVSKNLACRALTDLQKTKTLGQSGTVLKKNWA